MNAFCVLENDKLTNNFQKYLTVTGTFTFFVCVDIKRKPGTSNSSISIATFAKADRKIAIATKCRWNLVAAEGDYPIHNSGNSYQLSPRGNTATYQTSISTFKCLLLLSKTVLRVKLS